MSSTTTSTPLPTAGHLDASRKALSESFNRLSSIEMLLSAIHKAHSEGEAIDCTIDDAMIGTLYRYLSDVDIEVEQLEHTAREIRELVLQVDLDGRDIAIAARRQEASVDA